MNETVRILIIEDIKTDFDLAQREIRQAVKRCVFKHVETQEDFLTTLSVFQPDLILSDYSMPRFNGMKALELRNKHAPLTPFIVWTGSLSEAIAVECMKAGASNYIIKENIQRLGPAILHALKEGQLLVEQKQAETDIRQYADIVSHMQIGLYVFHLENHEDDHSFRLISANPAALRFSGTTAEEVVGKTLDEGFPDLREQGIPQKYAEVVRTQKAVEVEVVYYDDSQKLDTAYAVKAFPLPDDHLGVAFENTTARKQAEEKLSEQEKRFRSLIENSLDNISLLAQDGSLLWENPAVNRTLGYKQGEFVNRNIFELVHPDDLDWTSNTFANLIKRPGENERGIFRLKHQNGSWRWIDAIATNLLDEPSINALVINYRDITERKQTEEALRENQMILSQAEKMAHLGAWELEFTRTENINDNLLRWSDEVYLIFGYKPGAVKVTNDFFFECVHPDDRAKVADAFSRAIDEKRAYEIEHRVIRPDGSERIVLEHADITFDEDDQPLRMLGAVQDITERKHGEGETHRHLAELQALYENGLAVGRLLSPREIGERVIQTFTQYLSWHHVTIRLRKEGSDDLELVAFSVPHLKDGDSEKVERNFNARINKVGQGMSGWVVETGVAIRTGNVHTYPQYVNTYEEIQSGMYMPLKIGERVIGCISVESEKTNAFSSQAERLLATLANQAAVAFENARLYQAIQQELFDRKHAEVMLERERNSLAQHVEERTTDLQRANENLARALRVKDEFLANMSHELRTPLNAILGLSESLAEQVAGPLNDKQRKYVQTMSESGHHLLALINDILDLAKIEAGQITLDITKVDVESVCQASLRMVKQLAQKKNQNIELEIDPDFGLIWADERRLKQMIVNLLSNAVKFTQENGKIGLEIHGDKDENRALITVWDNGIGISENNLTQLFKPFIQLDAGLARETSGTGLGLALVAQMARLHGGSISVASIPGQGSRFTIVIPWEPALRADTIERLKVTGKFRAIQPNGKSRQTILLIEDTKEVIMLIKDYLELAGYNVVTAEDGIDGLSQARLTKPDLILMDLQMPRMDGIETTQKLRSEAEFKYTPIIALTALAMPNDRERCLAAGMDEYISKPVNLKTLVKIIQGFLTGEGTTTAHK